jgi:hypothetical protein
VKRIIEQMFTVIVTVDAGTLKKDLFGFSSRLQISKFLCDRCTVIVLLW